MSTTTSTRRLRSQQRVIVSEPGHDPVYGLVVDISYLGRGRRTPLYITVKIDGVLMPRTYRYEYARPEPSETAAAS